MKITIYGRENCSWCSKAKDLASNLLQSQTVNNYEYINYQKENISADDLSVIAGTQVKTVPIILLDGKYIGGYKELEKNLNVQKLIEHFQRLIVAESVTTTLSVYKLIR